MSAAVPLQPLPACRCHDHCQLQRREGDCGSSVPETKRLLVAECVVGRYPGRNGDLWTGARLA